MSNRREFQRSGRLGRHLVAEDDAGRILAYGAIEGDPEPGRFRIFLVMAPEQLRGRLGTELYERLRHELVALSATAVWAREEQRDTVLTGFLQDAGFDEVARFTFDCTPMLVLQLDLTRTA